MGSAYYIAISVKSMHVCTQEVVLSVALLIRPKVLDTVISDIQASAHINSHAFIFVLICSESTDLCIYFYFRFIILLFLTIKSSHYDLNANINVDCQGPDLFLKGDTNLLGMKEAVETAERPFFKSLLAGGNVPSFPLKYPRGVLLDLSQVTRS